MKEDSFVLVFYNNGKLNLNSIFTSKEKAEKYTKERPYQKWVIKEWFIGDPIDFF